MKKISVEGHASADGDDRHNMKLSERRAKAVMDYLVKKGGIAESMLVSKGWGETRPLDASDPESAVNRRVEFIILEQDVTETKVEIDPETGEKTVLEEKTSRVEK
ncbi:MAG TPA: OmpA family protein [Nannocystis exedens]|nr:OmpA family protein [Nannocystis exedens]